MKTPIYHWYKLDPSVGGYMAAHVGVGDSFQVFTTPISLLSQTEHRQLLDKKIYGKKLRNIHELQEDDEDFVGFYPCEDCDLPDACRDFDCAIKTGVRKI